MWAVWCESKRTGSASIGAVCSPRATASVSSPTGGFAGTNVNAADGDCVTPNRMEGIVPGTEVYRITTTVSTSSSPAAVRAA